MIQMQYIVHLKVNAADKTYGEMEMSPIFLCPHVIVSGENCYEPVPDDRIDFHH